jgi:hypothetical protein
MSDKKKILLVGIGLVAAAITAAMLFFFLGRDNSVTEPKNGNNEITTPFNEETRTIRGIITSISIEGTDITVSSEDGEHSFSISEANISDSNDASLNAKDLVIGMEIEAPVSKGKASSIRVLSIPLIAVTAPIPNSITNLNFDVQGIAYGKEGEICLTLNNRRTGTVYENNLQATITSDGKFSIPVDLSSALDAMSGDMLDAKLNVCGENESASISWGYYSGLTSKIKVYFLKDFCSNPYYVERIISASRSSTGAAIEEMLKGPNAKETQMGIFTSAKPSERIRSIDVQADTVYLDFYSSITNVSRCSLSALKTQITRTLSQFPIGKLVITIEGEEDNPLN